MQNQIKWDELLDHSTEEDFWIVIECLVYDLTQYLPLHPGGKQCLLQLGGLDATHEFQHEGLVNLDTLRQRLAQYQVGMIENNQPSNLYKIMRRRRQVSNIKISPNEVVKNKYCVMDGYVYDINEVMKYHVKGDEIMKIIKGKDCTQAFNEANHSKNVLVNRETHLVGVLNGYVQTSTVGKIQGSKFIKMYEKKKLKQQHCQCGIF